MGAEQEARVHQRRRAKLSAQAGKRVRRLWAGVDARHVIDSWRERLPVAVAGLRRDQTSAAATADEYVAALMAAYSLEDEPLAVVLPAAYARTAADGRELTGLLMQPALATLVALKTGASERRALALGAATADLIARTQVGDAGRVADQVAQTMRPELTSWVRALSLPSCSRCIVLAGKTYRWKADFLRHPGDDCTAIPAPEAVAGDMATDPRAAFAAMDPAEQDRAFTTTGAQAIRDGADVAQVVNARSGMYTAAGRRLTRTGATRYGLAGRRLGARRGQAAFRLLPEQIYREASDRDDAVRLLRLHGYVI